MPEGKLLPAAKVSRVAARGIGGRGTVYEYALPTVAEAARAEVSLP